MKKLFNIILIIALALATRVALAQDEVPPPAPDYQTLSADQLDQLLGPIALYPDPLISIILPAATFPTEIVEADRYINNGGDPNQVDQQGWDPSVQALVHYPSVLQWMDDNLNWTTQVGQAFENQQQDVMDSVQRLRQSAYNLGNLQSTPQQQVIDDGGYIEILPANPNNVYVPDYQPQQVYYQPPSGPPFITFSVGFIIGPWLCNDFDWRNHHLVVWDHGHPRPNNWWQERPDQRTAYFVRGHATFWNRNDVRTPALSGYQGLDRGYAQDQRTWNAPAVNRPAPAPVEHFTPPAEHNAPPAQQHFTPPPQQFQRPTEGAFIGIQSAQDTRTFSDRGQQSMQSTGHSEPSSGGSHGSGNSGGSVHSSGGSSGGGFHGGGNANIGGTGGGGRH